MCVFSKPTTQIVGTPSFLRSSDGPYTMLEAPDAIIFSYAINNAGQIVGYYVNDDDPIDHHGFLRSSDGAYTTIDVPGARHTYAHGIDDAGEIVGFYILGSRSFFGFVRSSDGDYSTIEVPGARVTYAYGINNNNNGLIVGMFEDQHGQVHGFLATPK